MYTGPSLSCLFEFEFWYKSFTEYVELSPPPDSLNAFLKVSLYCITYETVGTLLVVPVLPFIVSFPPDTEALNPTLFIADIILATVEVAFTLKVNI